jgi:hypothetical protein
MTQIPNTHTCFKCGADTMEHMTKRLSEDYGVEITFSTGYMSSALWDGSSFMMKVCEKCLKEWMLTFQHRPLHLDYMAPREEQEWAPATDDNMRLVPHMLTCSRHGKKYNHTADEMCVDCHTEMEERQYGDDS